MKLNKAGKYLEQIGLSLMIHPFIMFLSSSGHTQLRKMLKLPDCGSPQPITQKAFAILSIVLVRIKSRLTVVDE